MQMGQRSCWLRAARMQVSQKACLQASKRTGRVKTSLQSGQPSSGSARMALRGTVRMMLLIHAAGERAAWRVGFLCRWR